MTTKPCCEETTADAYDELHVRAESDLSLADREAQDCIPRFELVASIISPFTRRDWNGETEAHGKLPNTLFPDDRPMQLFPVPLAFDSVGAYSSPVTSAENSWLAANWQELPYICNDVWFIVQQSELPEMPVEMKKPDEAQG